MKSFDEFLAYEKSFFEESIGARDAKIIGEWKATKIVDLTIEVCDSLRPGERLTTEELRYIRESVDAMAIEKRDKIIAEALIDLAGERAE